MAKRMCPHCNTVQEFELVEEIPGEIIFKSHELNLPLRTLDRRGLLDLEFPLANFQTVVFAAHKGPCKLPCIGSYRHPTPQFEEHPGSLCREKGCRSKIKKKQLNLVRDHHNGSTCPCNVQPLPDTEDK